MQYYSQLDVCFGFCQDGSCERYIQCLENTNDAHLNALVTSLTDWFSATLEGVRKVISSSDVYNRKGAAPFSD